MLGLQEGANLGVFLKQKKIYESLGFFRKRGSKNE